MILNIVASTGVESATVCVATTTPIWRSTKRITIMKAPAKKPAAKKPAAKAAPKAAAKPAAKAAAKKPAAKKK